MVDLGSRAAADILENDMHIVRMLCKYFREFPEERVLLFQLLITVGEFDAAVYPTCVIEGILEAVQNILLSQPLEDINEDILLLSLMWLANAYVRGNLSVQFVEELDQQLLNRLFDILIVPDDNLPLASMKVIVAINSFYRRRFNNQVMKVLQSHPSSRVFGSNLIQIFNRGEHLSLRPTLKLFLDLFARSRSGALFYHNDLHVLVDVLLRELTNLEASDILKQDYLRVTHGLLRNTGYMNDSYRKQDLLSLLEDVANSPGQNDDAALQEHLLECQKLAQAILSECDASLH